MIFRGHRQVKLFFCGRAIGVAVCSTMLCVIATSIPTIAGAQPFAYVANSGSDTVSVIDTATNQVTATVPVGTSPEGVTISPSGAAVYVANFGAIVQPGTVSIIDTATNTVIADVPAGINPVGIALGRSGQFAYVTDLNSAIVSPSDSGTISVIDTAARAVVATIQLDAEPAAIAITLDGRSAYVTHPGLGTAVSVIDTSTNAVSDFSAGWSPQSLAISPDGSRLYVTNSFHPDPGVDTDTVTVVDTGTQSVVATIQLPAKSEPEGIAISPDGAHAYVVNNGGGTVSVIDTASSAIVTSIPVGAYPSSIALTADGLAYVTNNLSNTVSVIDTRSEAVIATVPVGEHPAGIAVSPAVTTASAQTGGEGGCSVSPSPRLAWWMVAPVVVLFAYRQRAHRRIAIRSLRYISNWRVRRSESSAATTCVAEGWD